MKYNALKYDNTINIGDQIQTLAVKQHFNGDPERYLNRDTLKHESFENDNETLTVMQGWYSHSPEDCLPASNSINPVFWGFHISGARKTSVQKELTSKANIEFYKKNEPIGCRDIGTLNLLKSHGVEAFYSKCLTLTFPKREKEPEDGKVFIVDAGDIPIPEELEKDAIHICMETDSIYSNEQKLLMADEIMRRYREEARLVITSRLHSALPCIATGVPVVFFGDPSDYRVSIPADFGVEINKKPPYWVRMLYRETYKRRRLDFIRKFLQKFYTDKVDWSGKKVDIEDFKEQAKKDFKSIFKDKLSKLQSRA